jgi:ASC-1-like (ASCH) protein
MRHEIKVESQYFEATLLGDKLFEVRYNDRGYQKGDTVLLREIERCAITERYTGRTIEAKITYVTGYKQTEDYVVFGLKVGLCCNNIERTSLQDGENG